MRTTAHHLKTLPGFFQPIWFGDKTFEVRRNDRDFRERDEIFLKEWDPETGYTKREVHGFILYVTAFQQQTGFVVFSFKQTYRIGPL